MKPTFREPESDKLIEELSAYGVTYNPELHYLHVYENPASWGLGSQRARQLQAGYKMEKEVAEGHLYIMSIPKALFEEREEKSRNKFSSPTVESNDQFVQIREAGEEDAIPVELNI